MKKIISLIILIGVLSSSQIRAQKFFDTSDASTFCSLSVRFGFNTSNKTFPSGHFSLWNHNSWGTGLNLGVLANLNFKEYLSIQPGIFFNSRSGDYTYLTEYIDYNSMAQTHYEMGHHRGYYLTVPVMGIVKFNIGEKVKWSAELGPYYQISFKETGLDNVEILYRLANSNQYTTYRAEHNTMDVGIKMGTGLKVFDHYYVGVHYLAGMLKAWKNPAGGKNKSWEFTLGYDF